MRQIGILPDRAQAQRFAAYLITQGISCEAEEEEEAGSWSVWVHDENRVSEARDKLASFRENPGAQEYQGHESKAERIVKEERERRTEAQKNMVDMRRNWANPPGARARFTMTLILISVAVTLITGMGRPLPQGSLGLGVRSHLQYVSPAAYRLANNDPLASIKKGQIWRTITPVFLHFDVLHLLFNMFMLFQLGRLLELKLGAPKLALMVVAIAVISNTAQASTPPNLRNVLGGAVNFGGMSGVVFGLFGYAWVRSQIDPAAGFFIPPMTVFLVLGWLVLCLTPAIPNIANTAHVVGLLAGMVAAQVQRR